MCLHHEGNPQSLLPDKAYLILNQSKDLVICGTTGTSPIIQVQLLQSTGFSNAVLKIYAVEDSLSHVAAAVSHPFRVVNYRLEIYNEDRINSLWFKDDGGKNNQIALMVRLVDATGSVISRPNLCFQLQLYYDDGEKVENQEILKIQPGQNMFLGENGLATFKFRIESVSKNHGHKMFCVEVRPDSAHDPSVNDISHPRSPMMLVKSKITKDNLKKKVKKQINWEKKSLEISNTLLHGGCKKRKITTSAKIYPLPKHPVDHHINIDQFLQEMSHDLRLLKSNLGDSSCGAVVDCLIQRCELFSNSTAITTTPPVPHSRSDVSSLYSPEEATQSLTCLAFRQNGSHAPDPFSSLPLLVYPDQIVDSNFGATDSSVVSNTNNAGPENVREASLTISELDNFRDFDPSKIYEKI
jgi:hypothetical protein